jgi:hypothetical protein
VPLSALLHEISVQTDHIIGFLTLRRRSHASSLASIAPLSSTRVATGLRAADIYTSSLSSARAAAGNPRVADELCVAEIHVVDELCTDNLHCIELRAGVELCVDEP